MTVRYRVITQHRLRRRARRERGRVERMLALQSPEDLRELEDLNVDLEQPLRVSPKRWKGYWRVEQMR